MADYLGARCLDGSVPGYYIRKSAVQPKKWVIYLQGGGLCRGEADCKSRAKTEYGSSKNWLPNWEDQSGVLSSNSSLNPFSTFNHVWLRYCSGDAHTGRQTSQNAFTLWFAGHRNVVAVFNHLINTTDLESATDVLLVGSSSGGIGVLSHANYVADLLPNAHIKAVAQGGFFFAANVTTYQHWQSGNFTPINADLTEQLVDLFDSYIDPTCEEAVGEDKKYTCWDASVLYPYIRTPLLVAENLFDTEELKTLGVQSGSPGEADYRNYFGKSMAVTLKEIRDTGKPSDGLFAPSCSLDAENLCLKSDLKIDNRTYTATLVDWFNGGTGSHRLLDLCAEPLVPCNSQCKSVC